MTMYTANQMGGINPSDDGERRPEGKRLLGSGFSYPPHDLSLHNIGFTQQKYQLGDKYYIDAFVHFAHPEDSLDFPEMAAANQRRFEETGTVSKPIEEYDVIALATLGPFSSTEEMESMYEKVSNPKGVRVFGRKKISLVFEEEMNIGE